MNTTFECKGAMLVPGTSGLYWNQHLGYCFKSGVTQELCCNFLDTFISRGVVDSQGYILELMRKNEQKCEEVHM
jgi:hypothetical protein